MIFFLTTAGNIDTIYKYLRSPWGKKYLPTLRPLLYKNVIRQKSFPFGTYIFADLELIPDSLMPAVKNIHARLSRQSGTCVLNDPGKTKWRYELLNEPVIRAANRFRVYRPAENLSRLRFPVFLRLDNDHDGARTGLIHNHQELNKHLRQWRDDKNNARILVCEFCDTSDQQGIFRKYSAFMLKGTIIPRHVFFSHQWHLKKEDLYDEHYFQEEYNYLLSNPHREPLARIFSAAGIDYGRIDYAVKDNALQVWEINTNPIILTPQTSREHLRRKIHDHFACSLDQSWNEIINKSSPSWMRRRSSSLQTQAVFCRISTRKEWKKFKTRLASRAPWLLHFYQLRNKI